METGTAMGFGLSTGAVGGAGSARVATAATGKGLGTLVGSEFVGVAVWTSAETVGLAGWIGGGCLGSSAGVGWLSLFPQPLQQAMIPANATQTNTECAFICRGFMRYFCLVSDCLGKVIKSCQQRPVVLPGGPAAGRTAAYPAAGPQANNLLTLILYFSHSAIAHL